MITQQSIDHLVTELKHGGCLKLGDVVLKSGARSNYYIDFRESTESPNLFQAILAILGDKLREILDGHPIEKVAITGVPYGVVPVAAGLAAQLKCAYSPLRKETKSYGREKNESLSKDRRTILIEDVMSTGSSIIEALQKLDGRNVTDVVVLANREAGGDERLREEYPNIRVHSILRASDMLKDLSQSS